jgi:hypothetical protein
VKIDVLYHWHEPPSFGALALADAEPGSEVWMRISTGDGRVAVTTGLIGWNSLGAGCWMFLA